MNSRLKSILHFISDDQGIDLSKYEDLFLNKSVSKRMEETFCETESTYFTYLEHNQIEVELLLQSLQISYTEFFRNSLTFSVLEKIIIPSIVMNKACSNGNEIRIWSAACAGGQETYSLAMLLNEFSKGHGEKINFRIFASDQSESQIHEAQMGQYPESALNCLTMKRVNQWFTKQGETYTVKPEIKENIDFSVFDLFNKNHSSPPTSIFGDFDLIICANLLFYYKPEYQKKIIQKTTYCLSKNGYLISGETERELFVQSGLHEVYPHTAIFKK
jgi:chemotaxis protein methyltransferase CheR